MIKILSSVKYVIIITKDQFKILHSEIMEYFQCIECDLKRIYSGMSSEEFDDEMDMLENSNLGNTLRKLKKQITATGILGYLTLKMNITEYITFIITFKIYILIGLLIDTVILSTYSIYPGE